ncbi:MAG: hypothetical protein Kow00121_47360 [Elainellaceae cyanobacterium]
MAAILALCGFAIYRLIAHARWLYLEQEMQAIAHALEDRIETALKQPGQIEPAALTLLPGLCIQTQQPCATQFNLLPDRLPQEKLETLYELNQQNYCIRFLNLSQQPIAVLQLPQTRETCQQPEFWQQQHDGQGHYYHLSSYPLHTQTRDIWGTIEMARSLNDLDIYLFQIELVLVAIIVAAISLAGICSWWLAGLAMQPIRQSYAQMEQFTADAAHELRTPLAALRAMVQTALRSDDLSIADAELALHSVNRQSQRLSKLVHDLLILCQIDQVQSIQHQPCCLNTLIQELTSEFAAIATASELTLSANDSSQQLLFVNGSEEQLYRAVSNLISNAIQYTPAPGTITVSLIDRFPYALIQVQDTGIGISLEEQSKIFDRFYRVNRERSRQQGGAGLGLAIVQAIVQAHHGSIQLQSQVNQGSTFTIRLPLLQLPSKQSKP